MKKLEHFLSIFVVAVVLMTTAIARDGKIFGEDIKEFVDNDKTEISNSEAQTTKIDKPTSEELKKLGIQEGARLYSTKEIYKWKVSTGGFVYSTTIIGEKFIGYGGPTPLFIFLENGKIQSIVPAKNNETPGFFNRLYTEKLFNKWNGITPVEAGNLKVDAVSGATFSSTAVINNVKAALPLMAKSEVKASKGGFSLSLKNIFVLLVLAFGLCCATIWKKKKKTFRIIQLTLNFLVLGIWAGNFLSLPLLVGWFSNGINFATGLVLFLTLMLALVMPFLNKKSYYCNNVCPFGAAQELAGKLRKKKIKLPKSWLKVLNNSRKVITIVLLTSVWLGVGAQWIQCEVFTAFFFSPTVITTTGIVSLALAIIFIILSIFMPRPYCRFICPTGMLLTISQSEK